MDFVAARAVLDRFAEAHKAARDLSEALDTAVSLERKQMELTNNVEHLTKEQALQQARLTAMESDLAMRTVAGQAEHGRQMEQLAQRRATTLARIEADKATATAALVAEMTAGAEALAQERARQTALMQQNQQLEASIAQLQAQAEEIKTRMRQFVQ